MARRYSDVMQELLDAVVGGEYREGDWLPSEFALRGRFGAGRGVLREALRGLEERGLLVVHAGRGGQVQQRERWDTRDPHVLRACIGHGPEPAILIDTIDARAGIEQLAARSAIRQASAADLDLLGAQIEQMEWALERPDARTAAARDPFAAAEAWFHHTLALLSDNAQLAKLVEPWHPVLAELRRARAPERDRSVVRHHRRILEGLSSREHELALDAVTAYAEQLARWLAARR
jgi:DNA-binding FadR family transcriptional regulator